MQVTRTIILQFGCNRLGNPDLIFVKRISDLHLNAKPKNGFHFREIRPQGGFQLTNPNPDFMDFLLYCSIGNPKEDLQNYSFGQWSSFC